MAKDALGREVLVGDLIAYGAGQGRAKAGFRVGLVIKTERPTVIPFERIDEYKFNEETKRWGIAGHTWRKMRTFTFMKQKAGDFAIIEWKKIQDKQLRELITAELPQEMF